MRSALVILRIASRNLWRQRRRTLLTGLALSVGSGFVVFLAAINVGFLQLLIERTVDTKLGGLQVHKRGHLTAEEPLLFTIADTEALRQKILAVPGVRALSGRLVFESLLNNGVSGSIALSTAFTPKDEYAVCQKRAETEGARLGDDTDAALIGTELAKNLGLTSGAQATLLATTAAGQQNAYPVTMRGEIEAGLPLQDKTFCLVSLALAQKLLRLEGHVTEYAIALDDLDALDAVAARMRQALGAEYEVHTWRERDRVASDALAQTSIVLVIIVLIVAGLAATAIVNTMMMSIHERLREIGTMLALGLKRRQIVALLVVEAALVAIAFAAVGALLGGAVCAWIAETGIAFASPDSKALVVFPLTTPQHLLFVVIGAWLTTLVAALYPSYKASLLTPVEALRG
ncbi:MAG: ABC transporter permease [Deltaproteobacteria bacterium]|nr:ABC transporter permease [Deltaproteobacteria bacterium]